MNVSGDDMDNWMANRMDDVDSLHVEIDNLNDLLVRFCFIRDIDMSDLVKKKNREVHRFIHHPQHQYKESQK
jgi:hypothetical protein